MDLVVQSFGDVVVVLSPAGRIDHKTVDGFQGSFSPYVERCVGDEGKIVLDLSGVDYMSSVGLRALMAAAKQVRQQEGSIVIVGLQSTLKEIFEISRFDKIFHVYGTVRDGIAALSSRALAAYDSEGTAPGG